MIGVALGLIVIGVVLLFIIPWVGIAAGVVGVYPASRAARLDPIAALRQE